MIIIYDDYIIIYGGHIWWSYPCKTLNSSSHEPCHIRRGYSNHALSETDSDGDGGPAPQLTGRGHIEFSTKGIPHAIVHFVEQLRLAGHIFMHDTCAPEACHKLICKMAMNRARKGTEGSTNVSIMKWLFRRLTWSHIIRQVQKTHRVSVPIQKTRVSEPYKVIVSESKMLHPSDAVAPTLLPYHFSPLRSGQHDFMCNDTRVTYHELGTLIARCMQWTPRHVFDHLRVRLYCSARVQHSSGESRSYWATESQYPWSRGRRRDFVEIDLGGGKIGIGQLTGFIEMDNLPANEPKVKSHAVIIRWLEKSSRVQGRDDNDRPVCDYPLSSNHCLWQWCKTPTNRHAYRLRGFGGRVATQGLWNHVRAQDRTEALRSEIRARYDVVKYDNIIRHVNVTIDPTTQHMLQTLQIV